MTLRTPLLLGLPGLPLGIPSDGFSGLQRAGTNRSSGSPMRRRLSASPLGPDRDGVQTWPRRTPSGHSFPLNRASPLFRRARGSASFALAVEAPVASMPWALRHLGQRRRARRARRGWRLRRLLHYGRPLALCQERPKPGPAPERFKSALTEISFTLLRKGGAQDAKLY